MKRTIKTVPSVVVSMFLVVISISVSITGCGIRGTAKDEYDDEEMLAKETSTYSYWEKSGSVDANQADLNFEFTGNDKIWEITSENAEEIACNYDIDVESGDFKVIEITENKNIVTLWESGVNDQNGECMISIAPGKTMIKIVGRDAKGSLNMELPSTTDATIEPINNSLDW